MPAKKKKVVRNRATTHKPTQQACRLSQKRGAKKKTVARKRVGGKCITAQKPTQPAHGLSQKRAAKTPCDKVPVEALRYDLTSGAGKLIHEIKQLSLKSDPYTEDDLSMIAPFFGVKCFTYLVKQNFSNESWRDIIRHMTACWGPK